MFLHENVGKPNFSSKYQKYYCKYVEEKIDETTVDKTGVNAVVVDETRVEELRCYQSVCTCRSYLYNLN